MQHDKLKSSMSVKVTGWWDSWGKSMAHGHRQQDPTKSEFDHQLQRKKVNENRNAAKLNLEYIRAMLQRRQSKKKRWKKSCWGFWYNVNKKSLETNTSKKDLIFLKITVITSMKASKQSLRKSISLSKMTMTDDWCFTHSDITILRAFRCPWYPNIYNWPSGDWLDHLSFNFLSNKNNTTENQNLSICLIKHFSWLTLLPFSFQSPFNFQSLRWSLSVCSSHRTFSFPPVTHLTFHDSQ